MMKNVRCIQFLAYGFLVGLLTGCAHAPTVVAAPPANMQDSCGQIRDFFKSNHLTSDAPDNMSGGCHMNMTNAKDRLSPSLDRYLYSQGWARDPAFRKGSVPSKVAYETPSAHCSIEKLMDSSGSGVGVTGGVGIGGGSHMSTGFGLGIGIGSSDDVRVHFKIDCFPKKTD